MIARNAAAQPIEVGRPRKLYAQKVRRGSEAPRERLLVREEQQDRTGDEPYPSVDEPYPSVEDDCRFLCRAARSFWLMTVWPQALACWPLRAPSANRNRGGLSSRWRSPPRTPAMNFGSRGSSDLRIYTRAVLRCWSLVRRFLVSLRKLENARSPTLGQNGQRQIGQPKQLVDKPQLRERITFRHPSGSPLPNHVDCLDSL
jgi:hypothetical protein